MRFLPLIAPLALVVSACASMPGAETASTQVDVTASYRERIMLPPSHVLTVKVEDVSLMDAPARVLAETSKPLEGRGPPYAVTLSVPNSEIDARHSYAVRAEIRDPGGALRFTTDTRHSVLTQGATNKADIIMVGVR